MTMRILAGKKSTSLAGDVMERASLLVGSSGGWYYRNSSCGNTHHLDAMDMDPDDICSP